MLKTYAFRTKLTEIQEMLTQERTKEAGYAKRRADHQSRMNEEFKAIEALQHINQPQNVSKDESSIRDRLLAMGFDIDAETYSRYMKLQSECNAMARDADMQPNNNQFACAVYIAENLKSTNKEKKIMLTMPPGEGKSRITVALLYLIEEACHKFHSLIQP